MQKLYCYVDESGQDTSGALFLVSVVITGGAERDALRDLLYGIEKGSGKGVKKWTKTTSVQKKDYIQKVLGLSDFPGRIYFSQYTDTRTYVDLTILTTAKAIHSHQGKDCGAVIFVDGLKRTERHHFAAGMRKLNIRVRKVRGLRDEADVFIRLADAICGLIRDVFDGDQNMHMLSKKGERDGILQKI